MAEYTTDYNSLYYCCGVICEDELIPEHICGGIACAAREAADAYFCGDEPGDFGYRDCNGVIWWCSFVQYDEHRSHIKVKVERLERIGMKKKASYVSSMLISQMVDIALNEVKADSLGEGEGVPAEQFWEAYESTRTIGEAAGAVVSEVIGSDEFVDEDIDEIVTSVGITAQHVAEKLAESLASHSNPYIDIYDTFTIETELDGHGFGWDELAENIVRL